MIFVELSDKGEKEVELKNYGSFFLLRVGIVGSFAILTPIIESRVTNAAKSSSDQPSAPSGRSGRTRYLISAVES